MTAAQYAAHAGRLTQQADELRPSDSDPDRLPRNLATYYLRAAAAGLRQLAEFAAQREKNQAATPRPD